MKLTKYIILLLLLSIGFQSFKLHKEYYSLTRIIANKSEKSLQITMKLFTDDLDLALQNKFEKKFELNSKREIDEANELLEVYLKQTFALIINNKKTSFRFMGKEYDKDVTYIYLEYKPIKRIKQIDIQASMLSEIFPEQENIIKFNIYNQRKSLILTNENNHESVYFN